MNDMNKEYAEALFALACENNCQDEYSLSLGTVLEIVEDSPEYITFLSSPAIALEERLKSIDEAFSNVLPEYVLSFLKLLCEKSRITNLKECIAEYNALVEACRNVAIANVVSAVELTDKQKSDLQKKLCIMSGKNVVIQCSIDESLLGGIVVEIDGKVIDGSLRHDLNNVKEVIGK